MMRTIVTWTLAVGMTMLLSIDRASAQPYGPMMSGSFPMMGWPMMAAMSLFWLLLLILMVLAILWMIKQLRT